MATYYVAKTGNNGNVGSLASPWLTISYGVGRLVAGDTLYVRAGTYIEQVTVNISGNSGNTIKILSYTGEAPVIDGLTTTGVTSSYTPVVNLSGNYIEFGGFEVINGRSRGIFSGAVNNLWIHHCKVHGCIYNGMYLWGNNHIIEYCDVYNNALDNYNNACWSNGVIIRSWAGGLNFATEGGSGAVYSGSIVRRCKIYENWGEGLSCFHYDSCIFEDNIVHDNYSVNIYIQNSKNSIVRKNIVYNKLSTLYNGGLPTGVAATLIALANEDTWNTIANTTVVNNLLDDSSQYWHHDGISGTSAGGLIAHNTVCASGASSNPPAPGNIGVSGVTIQNNATGINIITRTGSIELPAYYTLVTQTTAARLASVTTDFNGVARNAQTVIGGLEAGSTGGSVVTITDPGSQTDVIGSVVSLSISATDTALGALTYSATGLPTGLSIASLTGVISGTLSASGAFSSTISVVSSAGGSSSLPLVWSIFGALAAPWTNGDVGTVGVASISGTLNMVFLKRATGTDVYNLADSFGHFYQSSVKDWVLTCRVVSIQNTGTYSKFGLMLSSSLDPNAIRYTIDINPNDRLESSNRATIGGVMGNDTTLTTTARFLKIQKVGNIISRYYSFSAVPGRPNLAIGKIATSSSNESTSFPASNAVDQNLTTRWSSAFGDPQWISIDLTTSFIVDRVKLYWEAAYATNYSIQVSTDNASWITVYTTTTGVGGTVDLSFTPTTGRYVRVYGTGRATVWGYSLYEIEVYGEPVWTELGTSDTVTLPTTTYASCFVCSTNNSVSATGTFDNISFTETDPVVIPPTGSWIFGIAV